jgi:hypothetical protein
MEVSEALCITLLVRMKMIAPLCHRVIGKIKDNVIRAPDNSAQDMVVMATNKW